MANMSISEIIEALKANATARQAVLAALGAEDDTFVKQLTPLSADALPHLARAPPLKRKRRLVVFNQLELEFGITYSRVHLDR